jgi:hypothetical protein
MAAGGATASRKFRQPEKREARAVTCRRNGAADCALRLISSRISSLSGRSDAEQIDAHHTAIRFIGLVYISTFWKQFIGMMLMSTKQLGKL